MVANTLITNESIDKKVDFVKNSNLREDTKRCPADYKWRNTYFTASVMFL